MSRSASSHPVAADVLVAATEREGQALLTAAAADLDAPVPSCPGWTVTHLLRHVGRVYTSVERTVATRAQQMVPAATIPEPPAGSAILEWTAEAHERVVAALAGIGPDEAVWSWSHQRNGGFYHRRMAHETVVHRWDAEATFGSAGPLDAALAGDGVDEYLRVVLPFSVSRWERPLPSGALRLDAIDLGRTWRLAAGADGVTLAAGGDADAVVSASGAELFLLCWNRLDARALEVGGDRAVAEAWAGLAP